MSVARRLFEDPRNTYIVENDDPGAFDKRFAGRPGVHREQRCCRDRAPVWQPYLLHDSDDPSHDNPPAYKQDGHSLQVEDATGRTDKGDHQMEGYVFVMGPDSGYRPDFVTPLEWMRWQSVYWMPSPRSVPGLPNPPRWVHMPGDEMVRRGDSGQIEMLWCQKCETALESTWSDFLDALPVAARGIAMVASSVPVFGTAVSFAITTTVSLAEGEPIDQSLLDAVGAALPDQPASGMAFNTAVAIARGDSLTEAMIDGLPLDRSVRDVLHAAWTVVEGIASGAAVSDVALAAIQSQLTPEAQAGMALAQRVINGENVPELFLSQAEQVVVDGVRREAQGLADAAASQGAEAIAAARAKGGALFNQYVAEFGYQLALDRLSDGARQALQFGLPGGAALRDEPFVGTFGSVAETNVAEHDGFADQGKALIASGIRYRGRSVGAIVGGSTFSVDIDFFDLLNGVWTKRPMTYTITDAWRRGFTIAIGVCQGSSERGPGQLAIYQTLAEAGGRDGFDAGQAVQFERTVHGDLGDHSDITTQTSDHDLTLIPRAVPRFVDLSPDAALALAKKEGVTVEFVHAQSADDIFGEDLQTLMSGEGGGRAHTDAEIVVNVQRPVAGADMAVGTTVSLGVALAPGVS